MCCIPELHYLFLLPSITHKSNDIMCLELIRKVGSIMKRIVLVFFILLLFVSLMSCINIDEIISSKSIHEKDYSEERQSIISSIFSNTSETFDDSEPISSEVIVEPSEEIIVYADDEVVNQFIIKYNKITMSPFSDIDKGNIKTKYYAHSYGYSCELLNSASTNKINVTIVSNKSKGLDVAGMKDVFHDIVKAIDPSLSDEEIYNHFDELIEYGYLKEKDVLGSVIIDFVPDSNHWRGHITIAAQ